MCGITGYYSLDASTKEGLAHQLPSMVQALIYRGPDNQSHWVSDDKSCGLGHARLSILDLSDAGSQPMHSASGRYSLVFNGEIYNYQELKKELISHCYSFTGDSDTEVLLASIDIFGAEKTLQQLNGMFAFAVWDHNNNELFIARDRAGEKPLYFYHNEKTIAFASDLHPFKTCKQIPLSINHQALGLYFSHNYIPAPYSIFNHIYKLEAGHYLKIKPSNNRLNLTKKCYWSANDAFSQAETTETEEQLLTQFEDLLYDSVKKQMVSDVPLGAFLSGGIDSSTIVSVMQDISEKPVDTFTIGFKEKQFDESPYARDIAKHLGTKHHELIVDPQSVRNVIPKIPTIYSEPFADSSQLPTYLVSKLAREHVTVALSGDAGDELFAGYTRYQDTLQHFSQDSSNAGSKNQSIYGQAILHRLKHFDYWLDPLLTHIRNYPTFMSSTKLHRWISKKLNSSLSDYYRQSIEYWPYGILNKTPPSTAEYGFNQLAYSGVKPGTELLQLMDFLTYLPDDILCKVDRAAMANSLETRVPLLDSRLIEIATRFPSQSLSKNNLSKWPLRHVLYKHVPRELIERPKAGFAAPIGLWLKESLKEWADDLLSQSKLESHNLLDSRYIQHIWQSHQKTDADLSFHLWGALIFQQWYQEWKPYIQSN